MRRTAVSHPTHLSNTHFPHALTSAESSQISLSFLLSSAIRIWSVSTPFPSYSPLLPTLLGPTHICSAAAQPSSPPCPEPAAFQHPSSWILWLLESSSHAWWFQPEVHMPPGLHCSFGLSLNYFHWLLHFYPCFLSCLFSHSPSLSPPQLPSLKFLFLKYASSLKAFIINLSRNYLRDSSAALWFVHCGVFFGGYLTRTELVILLPLLKESLCEKVGFQNLN